MTLLRDLCRKHGVTVTVRRDDERSMIGVLWRRRQRSGPEPAILIGAWHLVVAVDVRPPLDATQAEALARWQAQLAARWAALQTTTTAGAETAAADTTEAVPVARSCDPPT